MAETVKNPKPEFRNLSEEAYSHGGLWKRELGQILNLLMKVYLLSQISLKILKNKSSMIILINFAFTLHCHITPVGSKIIGKKIGC